MSAEQLAALKKRLEEQLKHLSLSAGESEDLRDAVRVVAAMGKLERLMRSGSDEIILPSDKETLVEAIEAAKEPK